MRRAFLAAVIGALGVGWMPATGVLAQTTPMSKAALPATSVPETQPATTAPNATTRVAPTPTLANPAATPSIDEMMRWLDAGKTSDVLQQMMYIQGSKKFLEQYDKYELWMLKAEALLHARNKASALEAFATGEKEAGSLEAQAYAKACQLLLTKSPGLQYVPRPVIVSPGTPAVPPPAIDLLDRAQRKAALRALFTDEMTAARPTLEKAQAAHNLPDMVPAVNALGDMELLELAATGATRQTAVSKKAFMTHVQEVVGDSLKIIRTTTNAITQQANTVIRTILSDIDSDGNLYQWTGYRKRGLTNADMASLRETILTCNRIEPALAEIVKRLRANETATAKVTAEASALATDATNVLNADYTSEVPAPR